MKDLSSLTKKELIALLNKRDEEIKDVLNDNNYQDKLNNLLKEKETVKQRLSKIIDMELDDDIDRKEMFIQKERELLNQLNDIKSKITK